MKYSEFFERTNFSKEAIEKRTDKDPEVKVIVTMGKGNMLLDINEIGFDDKTATIYIEV